MGIVNHTFINKPEPLEKINGSVIKSIFRAA